MLVRPLPRRRERRRARRPATARSPTPAAASASCSTPPRSTPAAAAARRSRSPPTDGRATEARVDELLDLVGLDRSAARKRVRQYSLGMRQRLGIAHALLGDPEVLILDEPANGLDPEGMRWMRGLLRDFADRGGTVLLSSHLLGEVEAIADQLVIIGDGRIVAQGSRAELLAGAGTLVRAADEAALARRAGAAGLAAAPPTAASSSTPSPRRSAAPRSTAASRSPPRPVRERRARAAVLRPDLRRARRPGAADLVEAAR